MKKILLILLSLVLILGIVVPTVSASFSSDVSLDKDTVGYLVVEDATKQRLVQVGIDPKTTRLIRDYGDPSYGGQIGVPFSLASSRTYKDSKTGQNITVFGGLPYVDAFNSPIVPRWEDRGAYYRADENTFVCVVQDDVVTLVVENDQGRGFKNGDTLQYRPQLFLGTKELFPTSTEPVLLDTDPLNDYYTENTLVWDYGICLRKLRVIEGRILGFWEFTEVPVDDITIKYNQNGPFRLDLGMFSKGDDVEVATVEEIERSFRYSSTVYICDELTFNPDANPETSSVDGRVGITGVNQNWATIHATATGNYIYDALTQTYIAIEASSTSNQYQALVRSYILFDTSSLPTDANISAATISMYGSGRDNTYSGNSDTYNIYSSSPASNTGLVGADMDQVGSVKFSDDLDGATEFNTSGYNDWELNSSGIAAIDVDGISKYSVLESNYDGDNDIPNWESNKIMWVYMYNAEQGSGYEPKLVVVYGDSAVYIPRPGMISPSSGPGGMFF